MKQVLQSLRTGATELAEVPSPALARGHLLIKTTKTLVSSGTERMLVEFGKASWIEKARQQPDKVAMVLAKMRADGILPTIEAVFNKLEQPLPLGYCNVGRVLEVGAGVSGYAIGDRVISNGKHAEIVSVPVNLCAKIPDSVTDERAAFTVLGAIALQGIRLLAPTLGETVVVTGLGVIGLLAVQLLRAHGCRVLGLDFDANKVALAKQFGAEAVQLGLGGEPEITAHRYSRGRGVDAVLVTASTSSNEPVRQAARMCRKRGRIVLVGVTGLELSRAEFYEKELTFQVSCSYGPGRYDPDYEVKGIDYPLGFVRWTEQRNFEAILDTMSEMRLIVDSLISHRFPIDAVENAYALVTGASPSLGILVDYPASPLIEKKQGRTVILRCDDIATSEKRAVSVAFIGAGNYATSVLMPAFEAAGANMVTVVSANGVSGLHAGRKFHFLQTSTDLSAVFDDKEIALVVVATRHDSHAKLVCEALRGGKHVFVEKPVAMNEGELEEIQNAWAGGVSQLMVGFNRRFAPQVKKIKSLLSSVPGPKSMVMTVNAGAIDQRHWTQDADVGGGRILGEACHFIDLLRHLAGAPIVESIRMNMNSTTNDTTTLSLRFADDSIGTIHYFSNGNKSFPKERLEVFVQGRVLQLDNFRHLTAYGWPGFSRLNIWRQDKGQRACVEAFLNALREGNSAPIPFEEIMEVGRVSVRLASESR